MTVLLDSETAVRMIAEQTDHSIVNKRVYLDNHSTTRLDPRVLEAMLPFLSDTFGNPASSSHSFGKQAHAAVEEARQEIASFIGAKPYEIVFTSGATESNNLALKGVVAELVDRGNHIITSSIEHPSVRQTCKTLSAQGWDVCVVPVDHAGLIDPGDIERAITDKTILISVMHANNEIGVLQNLREIGRICADKGVLFHTDGAQSLGKVPFNVDEFGVDLASFSAHKMYGPKGIGALYVKHRAPKTRLTPLIDGGGQESGIRSGTLNVPGIIGFSRACSLAAELEEAEAARLLKLREALRIGLMDRIDGTIINGDIEKRLPGNLHVSFEGVAGHSLLAAIEDSIAVSSGSACHSGTGGASHVLKAIGISDELADSSIRFGIGRFNVSSEIEYTIDRFTNAIRELRKECVSVSH